MSTVSSRPSLRRFLVALAAAVALTFVLGWLYELIPHDVREAHYPSAHAIVEIFSMIVAGGLFMLAWNNRRNLENHYLLWIGIAYAFVAIIDLLHTLTYRGMGDSWGGAPRSTQLWIAARGMQVLALVAAPFFIRRRLNEWAAMAGFAIVTVIVVMSIFVWDFFPECFRDGLTPFKIVSEYVISALLLVSVVLLVLNRKAFDVGVLRLLVASITVTICSEMAFTFYLDPFAAPNMVGHIFKTIAFGLLYLALIDTALRRPMDVLFRELKQREVSLKQTQRRQERLIEAMRKVRSALEVRVQDRTKQLNNTVKQLEMEAEDRIKAQEALRQQSRILELFTRKYSRQEYLQSVTEELRNWSGCRCVGIRIGGAAGEISYESFLGFSKEFWQKEKTLKLGADNCACTRVALGQFIQAERKNVTPGGSFYCSDLQKLVELMDEPSRKLYRGECMRHGFRSMMIVPVRYRDSILGLIHIADERPGLAGEESAAFLESIAPLIGEAIHRLNIEKDRRRLEAEVLSISESERQRIGQDLHDSLGQMISGIGYFAAALAKKLADKSLPEAQDVQKLEEIIGHVVSQTRRLARGLSPVGIHSQGLLTGLKELAATAEEMFGISCVVEGNEVTIASSSASTHLYRIAQEAVTNAVKHGKANRVIIELRQVDGVVGMRILDDGIGIDDKARPGEGMGLRIMKHRAGMFGGELTVHKVAPHGTVVHCSFKTAHRGEL
jgi:signal transduction histidine kinase